MRPVAVRILCVSFGTLFLLFGCAPSPPASVDLSPASWPAGDLEKYEKLNNSFGVPSPDPESEHGMVVGTTGALAVRAGVEALRQGGSAVDAALTTSLAQVCLNAGSVVSYAGIMTLVYYDAETGEVSSMNAGWNAPLEESDPLSIPFMGTPSGRQVLVPGYMAGVEAAHERFGTLEFAELFEPAIYFAEQGFELNPFLYSIIVSRKHVIEGSPDLNEILSNEGGEPYEIGDLLTQPKLAATLRAVAENGADHMYTGPWARSCVKAVNDHGGKLTLADFESYEVTWSKPHHARYGDFDVYAVGGPGTGGAKTISALNLVEVANLKQFGHWTQSSEALYRFIQISRASQMVPIESASGAMDPESLEFIRKYIDLDDFSPSAVTAKSTAQSLWQLIEGPAWSDLKRAAYEASLENSEMLEEGLKEMYRGRGERPTNKKPGHSDAVVAVDAAGNVAALVHTINGGLWGNGIVVDGVALNDSASFQQPLMEQVGPGCRVPDPTNPLVVLSNGRPILGASCIGGGLHEAMMQMVINVLDFGMDPKEAVETPHFMTPVLLPSESFKQSVAEGDFPAEVLEEVRALGQELEVVPRNRLGLEPGYWIGIEIDPDTGRMTGGVPARLNGIADGF